MNIEVASKDIIPEWIGLAREIESIFQGSMADNEVFNKFMLRKIEKKEAFIIRNKKQSNELMGLITISHNYNRISWFAVFEKYRKMGVGSKLLEYALNELDAKKEVTVITFREDYKEGIPARRTYQKFGFEDYNTTIYSDGHPRSLMKKLPKILYNIT